MDQFYVTLPSNTASDLNNTPSKFSVHLPQKIRLSGDWECGLCQIIYPHNFLTIREHENIIKIITLHDNERIIRIPTGCYESINDLIDTIQTCIHEGDEDIENVKFVYKSSVKRVCIKIPTTEIKSLEMATSMQNKLGLANNLLIISTCATNEPSVSSGSLEVMYIYANILEHQIVGDISAPLLRIVNVEGKYPSIIDKTFDFPHYIPILVKDISDIEINIKDDINEFIPFVSGKVIVKLHFRKIRHSLF